MIGYFVRHPVAANLLMGLTCLLGVSVIASIERESFPEFAADTVAITVPYPGASARDVDSDICVPLEDALTGLSGLSDFECLSVDGRARATAELDAGGEIIQFFNDVFSSVAGIGDLPADAETPVVEIAARSDLVAMVAVTGIAGRQGLIDYAEDLSDRLRALPGVAETTVSGVSLRELRVTFDAQALRRFGLSGDAVIAAIEARSLTLPLGSADLDAGSLTLRYAGASRSLGELEDLVIRETPQGGVLRLRDLGRVDLVDSDETRHAMLDGADAAIVSVSKSPDADSLRVFDAMSALMAADTARLPEPFALTVINNRTETVRERLSLISGNIVLGLGLVFVTMWLFFSLREALWISATLPVSFLGSLFVMAQLGITINMVTMIGLLMAVGLIMDDSIVIAENVNSWRRRAGPVEAAIRGTTEVLPGVLSSFLTTACVFGPLMFLSGDIGQVLQFIPMVLLITLSLSLFEGFVMLPHHLSTVPNAADPDARPAVRALDRVKARLVLPLAARLVTWRYATLGCVFAALILSIGLVASGQIKVVGFPTTESDTVIERLSLTSGIDSARTEATVARLLEGLAAVDARFTPGTATGAPLVRRVLVQYGVNSDVDDTGSHTATITVDLLETARRNVAADTVLAAWRGAAGPLPDVVQLSFAQAEIGPGGQDLDVEVAGRDPETVERAAAELLAALVARDDVTEAFQDLYGGRQELRLRLNALGQAAGLTPQNLAGQVRDAFEGRETDSFRSGPASLTVRVQMAEGLSSLTDLDLFPITLPDGSQAALARVADLTLARSYPVITRKNGMVVAHIRGQIDRRQITPAGIAAVVTGTLAPEIAERHPGVQIRIGGAAEDQQASQASTASALLLGLVGVYVILAFQFRSYTLPVVVMLSIPFALIGTILGHWALGMNLAMPSFIGFASLAGIVVNNAILFLTFFQTHLRGDDYVTAALDAVRDRFRPVFLSSATTVAGLLPIIAETSPHVQTLVPLVVAVAFGLMASMVLVVLVFPAVLAIYFDIFSLRGWIARFAPATSVADGAQELG